MTKKYLSIIFCIISLVITLLINSIISAYDGFKLVNPFANENLKSIHINDENFNEQEFLNIIKNHNNIAAYIDQISIDVSFGQAIYFNNFSINIPMISGRFLSNDDFLNNDSKSIVIGKNLKKYITHSDNKDIIRIQDTDYEVIGIMGYNEKTSIVDSRFFINLNGYLHSNPSYKYNTINLTSKNPLIFDELSSIYKNIEIKDSENSSNILNTVLYRNQNLIVLVVIIVILFLMNITNISSYYIKSKLKEIGIRISYGAKSTNIFLNIFRDYFTMITLGSFISFLLYLIILKLNLSSWLFGTDIHLTPIILTYFITLSIGIIISLFTLIGCNKYKLNQLIKGV